MDDHTFPHELDSHSRRQSLFDNERGRFESEIEEAKVNLTGLGKLFFLVIVLLAIVLLVFKKSLQPTFWTIFFLALCAFVPIAIKSLSVLAKLIESRRNLQTWEKITEACAEADVIDENNLIVKKEKTN